MAPLGRAPVQHRKASCHACAGSSPLQTAPQGHQPHTGAAAACTCNNGGHEPAFLIAYPYAPTSAEERKSHGVLAIVDLLSRARFWSSRNLNRCTAARSSSGSRPSRTCHSESLGLQAEMSTAQRSVKRVRSSHIHYSLAGLPNARTSRCWWCKAADALRCKYN